MKKLNMWWTEKAIDNAIIESHIDDKGYPEITPQDRIGFLFAYAGISKQESKRILKSRPWASVTDEDFERIRLATHANECFIEWTDRDDYNLAVREYFKLIRAYFKSIGK